MKLRALVACLLCACALSAHTQEMPPAQPVTEQHDAPAGPTISLEQYQQQLTRMQSLLVACGQSAAECITNTVPPDAQVKADQTFEQRWQWLRLTLQLCQDPKVSNRLALLDAAAQRLRAESLLATQPAPPPDVKSARAATDSILNQAEFRRVQHASYLQRKLALFGLFLDRLFSGVAGLIPRSPWFATLLEWALLAAAIIALMLWAWRLNQQQRLAIITHAATPNAAWQKESEDWSARADDQAQQGNWREAVHCLYWSAIVLLEGQKLWRQNRARTPREYLPLLEPGTPRRDALTALTRVFERIWYGLRPASPDDYTQATELLNRIKAA